MEQRLADRAAEVKALVEQLAQARIQFEHFQKAIATQRLEDRRAFDRHAGRLEHDLASAQQHLMAQQATLAHQDTQLVQLRSEHVARADDLRAARAELATVMADRVQLTRQLAEIATSAEVVASKLENARQEVIEVRLTLAAQQGQAELLADQLAGAAAKRDKLAQENATLRGRALN